MFDRWPVPRVSSYCERMAAGPGFEPGLEDPKSPVLPLHNPAPEVHAEGRTRTDTEVALQQFLRLPRLPFRHSGTRQIPPRFHEPSGRDEHRARATLNSSIPQVWNQAGRYLPTCLGNSTNSRSGIVVQVSVLTFPWKEDRDSGSFAAEFWSAASYTTIMSYGPSKP